MCIPISLKWASRKSFFTIIFRETAPSSYWIFSACLSKFVKCLDIDLYGQSFLLSVEADSNVQARLRSDMVLCCSSSLKTAFSCTDFKSSCVTSSVDFAFSCQRLFFAFVSDNCACSIKLNDLSGFEFDMIRLVFLNARFERLSSMYFLRSILCNSTEGFYPELFFSDNFDDIGTTNVFVSRTHPISTWSLIEYCSMLWGSLRINHAHEKDTMILLSFLLIPLRWRMVHYPQS